MRVLLQRETRASVTVDGTVVGSIDAGLALLVGAGGLDAGSDTDKLADKVANLRIFNNDQGKFNQSLPDLGGGALVVSQFTLYADARRDRRPSFTDAARPDLTAAPCDHFADRLRRLGVQPVEIGVFGAAMDISSSRV